MAEGHALQDQGGIQILGKIVQTAPFSGKIVPFFDSALRWWCCRTVTMWWLRTPESPDLVPHRQLGGGQSRHRNPKR